MADRVSIHSGLITYILLTDSHYTYNGTWDDTIKCMKMMTDLVNIDGIIHLGDMSDGLLSLKETRRIEERCIKDMESMGLPVFIAPGNHDYNYFHGNPQIKYPDRPQFYVDIAKNHFGGVRLIFIDSFDPLEKTRYGFSVYCINWLEAAFRSMPDGFCAVIFSHLPPLVRLQSWTKDIRNRNSLMDLLNKYADRILAYINGHNHCDLLYNDLYNGKFPVVSINCAKCEYFTDHKPEGAVVPYRRLGDKTQESFDIMQIDPYQKEIYFTRFGAGIDRVIQHNKAAWNSDFVMEAR